MTHALVGKSRRTKRNKKHRKTKKGGMFNAMRALMKDTQESEKFEGKGIPYTDVLPFDRPRKKTINVLVFGPGLGSKRSVLEEIKKSDPRFHIDILDPEKGEGYCNDAVVSDYLNTNRHPHVIVAGSRSAETLKNILENKEIRPYTHGVLLLGPEKNFRGVCDNAPENARYVVVYGTADPHMRIKHVRWGVLHTGQHELIEMDGFGHDLTKKDVESPWIGGQLMASLIYRAKISTHSSVKTKTKKQTKKSGR
jgi:hypothetical protein